MLTDIESEKGEVNTNPCVFVYIHYTCNIPINTSKLVGVYGSVYMYDISVSGFAVV